MCSENKKEKLKELLDYVRGDYNVFYATKAYTAEVVHSGMIADLLNPKGHHLLGDTPLNKFCEIINKTEVVKSFEINHEGEFYIKCEKKINNKRRIDIYIKDHRGKVVIIENKIYAEDKPSQLYDYYQYGVKQAEKIKNLEGTEKPNLHLFYLTLEGNNPSEESICRDELSITDNEYTKISYKEHILPWVEDILSIEKLYQGHVLFYLSLLQYRDAVENLVKGEEILLNKISAAINENNQKIGCNKDDIIKYLATQLRAKITQKLKLKPDNTKDDIFIINNSIKIKIWDNSFFYSFFKQKKTLTDKIIIDKLNEIAQGHPYPSEDDKFKYYYWTLSEIHSDNTLINKKNDDNPLESLTPNDLELLLSDKDVYSPNFEQIIKTLTKYIDIVKRPK